MGVDMGAAGGAVRGNPTGAEHTGHWKTSSARRRPAAERVEADDLRAF